MTGQQYYLVEALRCDINNQFNFSIVDAIKMFKQVETYLNNTETTTTDSSNSMTITLTMDTLMPTIKDLEKKSVPLSQPRLQQIPVSTQEQAEFGNDIAGHTSVVYMEAKVVTTKPITTRITQGSNIEWVVATKLFG